MTDKVGIVIGYRDRGELVRARAYGYVCQHFAAWRDAPILTIDPPGTLYSRALAFNLGAAALDCEILVCANSDVVISHAQLSAAVIRAESHAGTVYPFTDYYELTQHCSDRWIDESDTTCLDHVLHMDDSVGPIFIIRRDLYRDAGGCDARFVGWGFEDVAWAAVSETLLGPHARIGGDAIHFWHEPLPESWAHKPPVYQQNQALCNRYTEAKGDVARIRALQAEHGG